MLHLFYSEIPRPWPTPLNTTSVMPPFALLFLGLAIFTYIYIYVYSYGIYISIHALAAEKCALFCVYMYVCTYSRLIRFLLLIRFGNARAPKTQRQLQFSKFIFVSLFEFRVSIRCDAIRGKARARSLLIVRYFLNFDGSLFVCD